MNTIERAAVFRDELKRARVAVRTSQQTDSTVGPLAPDERVPVDPALTVELDRHRDQLQRAGFSVPAAAEKPSAAGASGQPAAEEQKVEKRPGDLPNARGSVPSPAKAGASRDRQRSARAARHGAAIAPGSEKRPVEETAPELSLPTPAQPDALPDHLPAAELLAQDAAVTPAAGERLDELLLAESSVPVVEGTGAAENAAPAAATEQDAVLAPPSEKPLDEAQPSRFVVPPGTATGQATEEEVLAKAVPEDAVVVDEAESRPVLARLAARVGTWGPYSRLAARFESWAPAVEQGTILDFSPGVDKSRRRLIAIGVLIIALGFGGLGTWAALAPLKSASLAPGVVKVASERKTVQHLEGGIVKDILVKEDQEVTAQQVLLRLEDTTARTRHELLQDEHDALTAALTRLEAERKDASKLVFPPALEARRKDPKVARLLTGEEQLFTSRREAMNGQISVLSQRKQQYQAKVVGLKNQIESNEVKARYTKEEIRGAEELMKEGMYTKPKYFALKRSEAELGGEVGRLRAQIAETAELVGETDLRIMDLRNQFQKEVSDKLQEVHAKLNDLGGKLGVAADTLARTEVVAPQAGTVIGLKEHTPGGVIKPGAPILDIVPKNDKLIVEAHVRPEDIDRVYKGLEAEVRFPAFSSRTTPTLQGHVTRVSADRFTDPNRGNAYYVAQVEIDPKHLSDLKLQPGMPAEVYILTGERTTFGYLFKPIVDQLQRGMLEK